jgi:hypothetical protein
MRPTAHRLYRRSASAAVASGTLTAAILIGLMAGGTAEAQTLLAAPSTRATAQVTLVPEGRVDGDTTPLPKIRVDYGQPHLRGRTLHTGNLVPYDRPWRTGANEVTTLTTDVDLTIGGASVPAGSYVLFTLPSETQWKLIIQRNAGQDAMYDPAHDVAQVDLRKRTLPAPLESMSIWLIPSTADGPTRGELRLVWGTTELMTDWVVR